jgi:hypothetical protein
MGYSFGRDAFIGVEGVGRYIDTASTKTNKPLRGCHGASLAPFAPLILGSFFDSMADLLHGTQRSSSGDHPLLPAADSHGTTIASFMSISTLFAWTFGSGAVVCGRHLAITRLYSLTPSGQ